MNAIQKEMAEKIKGQWRHLWQERMDDKVRAEGVATNDYSMLFVDRGTVIHATRNFKPLRLKEIMEQNQIENAEQLVPPNPAIGGWNKFIKTSITNQKRQSIRRTLIYVEPTREKQQLKKGGRGWLHK
jgi:hypothetical protein